MSNHREAANSRIPFSALGRAVWDETLGFPRALCFGCSFSALGRAVWDETVAVRDG